MPPTPLAPGERLDRYRVESILGAGGMGIVYRAYDEKLKRPVALKVVQIGGSADEARVEEARERLRREAHAAAALQHPNVVAIYDVGEHEGAPYIAMELVEGATLRAKLDGHPPWRVRLGWLLDVARALAAAHEKGIVHRDIKPENVIVRRDGLVKVLDFGIARRLAQAVDPTAATAAQADAKLATLTREGAAIGTPVYMAPEQIQGRPLDGRADQFAWAVLSYEVLSGRSPWSGADLLELAASILGSEPEPLRTVAPDVPVEVSDVVGRALAKSPDARFASMEPIVTALTPFTQGAPEAMPAAPRPGVVQADTSARGSAPRRWGVAALAAVVALLGATVLLLVRTGPMSSSAGTRGSRASPTAVDAAASPGVAARTSEAATISASAAATDAYMAGIKAMHDGSSAAGLADLERALALDETLAAAAMRLALSRRFRVPTEAREIFARAQAHRGRLSASDADLLDAFSPCVLPTAWDWEACEQRTRQVVAAHPDDPELWLELASTLANSGKLEEAFEPIERALALDPTYLRALYMKGVFLAYVGRAAEGRTVLEACLARSPGAIDCFNYLQWVLDAFGECDALERAARATVAVAPTGALAFDVLAGVAVARGELRASVDEALALKWSRLPPGAGQDVTRTLDQARLAALRGAFDEAEVRLKDAMTRLASNASDYERAVPVRLLLELYRETGRTKVAAELAAEFEARRGVLLTDPRRNNFGIGRDIGPRLWAAELVGGLLGREAYVKKRDGWLASWSGAHPRWLRYRWVYSFAATAETREDAEEALRELPPYAPLPPFLPFINIAESDIGKVYALAGRFQEASEPLARAARTCRALEQPFESTRAHWFLGVTREALGATSSACAAYQVVLARWGDAKPKSVTAQAARKRLASLHCQG